MILRDILRAKGSGVYTISPRSTLSDVVAKLVLHNCGSLVVVDGERLLGIITERDILRASAAGSEPLEQATAESHMSEKLITGEPGDHVEKIMGLMTEKRMRHLPVLENGKLAGMISIGDVVKAQYAQLSVENKYLKDYIQS